MAISLVKGQTIDLSKKSDGTAADLSSITIGLGWQVRKKPLFSLSKVYEYDLDASAVLLGANGKIQVLGDARLVGGDLIYFNNLQHPSGAVRHSGDNLVGGGGGDDEQIVLNLGAVPPQYERIVFLVTIYQGHERKQHFGEVKNAFIRAVDGKRTELARYPLSDDGGTQGMCSLIFGEVYRKDAGWKFRALGEPMKTDNLVDILKAKFL